MVVGSAEGVWPSSERRELTATIPSIDDAYSGPIVIPCWGRVIVAGVKKTLGMVM